jgi:hypothetical protein
MFHRDGANKSKTLLRRDNPWTDGPPKTPKKAKKMAKKDGGRKKTVPTPIEDDINMGGDE